MSSVCPSSRPIGRTASWQSGLAPHKLSPIILSEPFFFSAIIFFLRFGVDWTSLYQENIQIYRHHLEPKPPAQVCASHPPSTHLEARGRNHPTNLYTTLIDTSCINRDTRLLSNPSIPIVALLSQGHSYTTYILSYLAFYATNTIRT